MKKVLEDELMSLAHRILKLRNRAEIHELKEEAAVLYEKLSVLSFAEKHLNGIKPTIKKYDVEKAIEAEHSQNHINSDYPDGTEYNEEQIYEHNTEKIKDIVSQMPYESGQVDSFFEDKSDNNSSSAEKSSSKIDERLEDFGVHFDDLPDFEPADDSTQKDNTNDLEEDESNKPEKKTDSKKESKEEEKDQKIEDKPQRTMDLFSQGKKSLNDSLNQNLKIGLNDRLSFIKHLFKGDNVAYEEFIQNINQLESFEKVKSYLDTQIQNKYSYWKDQEDIANRLLSLIQKKFE